MKFLLDTHAIVWLMAGSPRLGKQAKTVVSASPPGHLGIADITLFELALLLDRGTIQFDGDSSEFLAMVETQLVVLPQTAEIAWKAVRLPLPQKDPFDRLITATALVHGLALVTRDRNITKSGLVPVIW